MTEPAPAIAAGFSADDVHAPLLAAARPALAFAPGMDHAAWRPRALAALQRALGVQPEPVDLQVRIEREERHDGYRAVRFTYVSEANATVPAWLLIPDGGGVRPCVICLQGHTRGFHISLGLDLGANDAEMIAGERDFARQAVRRGWCALAIEQRAFGERASRIAPDKGCHHPSMAALLLGRTMVGERVWDVRRAIDALAGFAEVDRSRIAVMGNSGGGTISAYAAAVEPRIAAAMPSCSVCTYAASIGSIHHCADNYVPGILRDLEMADMVGLIAPRPLVVVAGRTDPIFPFADVERCAAGIAGIYAAAGRPQAFRLVPGDGGHRFYAESAWSAFSELTGW